MSGRWIGRWLVWQVSMCSYGAIALDAQVAVLPGTLIFHASRVETAVLRIRTQATEGVEVALYFTDWSRDFAGGVRVERPGAGRNSCGNRLHVSPEVVTLTPHAITSVRVAWDGGDTSAEGCWAILFVEPLRGHPEERSYSLTSARVPVTVYVAPVVERRSAEVVEFRIEPEVEGEDQATSSPAVFLVLDLRNSGTMPLTIRGGIRIRRVGEGAVLNVLEGAIDLLPGDNGAMRLMLPRLESGRYIADATFFLGENESQVASTRFEVK